MPSLREELKAACADVRRQIEVQKGSWSFKAVNDAHRREAILAELEAELAELEAALANLDNSET
ncbi:hypothetical protein [Phenylobacterium sp.]|uniref:hypothetical protein n=1 Tax=Phenylobacterium sp. TaxID=1871053 RepID=UPI001225EEB8|nr:hypothetical protein [Phenylobacterium sp.]THD64406.1 MAG: hypothetical protein E8A49_02700 [Phenylobacterium sp.]